MPLSLDRQYAMANDPYFQQRVQTAMIVGAAAILSETIGTTPANTFQLRNNLAAQIMVDATPLVTRFSWAMATTTFNGIADAEYESQEIFATQAAFPAIIQLEPPGSSDFATGWIVEIINAEDPTVNGNWPITVISPTEFSIPIKTITFGGRSGIVTSQATDAAMNAAMASVWNAVAGINTNTG